MSKDFMEGWNFWRDVLETYWCCGTPVNSPIPQTVCKWWWVGMIEREQDKWQGQVDILNVRFYWVNLTRKMSNYDSTPNVKSQLLWSLCWVLKVRNVESRRLGCLEVWGDSASRRWGWSRCLMQIVGSATRSACRRNGRRWTHTLQKLNDECPGLCNPCLTGVGGWCGYEVLVLVWAALSLVARELLHDLICCNKEWRCWFADARTGQQLSTAKWCKCLLLGNAGTVSWWCRYLLLGAAGTGATGLLQVWLAAVSSSRGTHKGM